MADMRRRSPEPDTAIQVLRKSGMAQELLDELAPLLAEEGIEGPCVFRTAS